MVCHTNYWRRFYTSSQIQTTEAPEYQQNALLLVDLPLCSPTKTFHNPLISSLLFSSSCLFLLLTQPHSTATVTDHLSHGLAGGVLACNWPLLYRCWQGVWPLNHLLWSRNKPCSFIHSGCGWPLMDVLLFPDEGRTAVTSQGRVLMQRAACRASPWWELQKSCRLEGEKLL